MRKTPAAIAVGATAAAVIAFGSVAYAAIDKSVTLTVDGKTETVHSLAGDVQSVLDKADVKTSAHDLVAPEPATPVADGDHIVVRHGRQVTVTVDGKKERRWVTALSVAEALNQLGLDDRGMWVSANRSRRIPLDGMAFRVSTPKHVRVVTAHKTRRMVTTASTVGQVIRAAGVHVDGNDLVSPAARAMPEDGMRIIVKRVRVITDKKKVAIDPPTHNKKTDDLVSGDTQVKDSGEPGVEVVVWKKRYVDGKLTEKHKVDTRVVKKAEPRVVLVGTGDPSSGSGDGGSMDGSFWTLGGLNWRGLAECESGLDPRAVNPNGHYGLYQFSLPTWQSVGGSGNPIDASPEEQTERAYELYQRAGAGQWSCGYRL